MCILISPCSKCLALPPSLGCVEVSGKEGDLKLNQKVINHRALTISMVGICVVGGGEQEETSRPGNRRPYGSLWRSLDFILRTMGAG